MTPSFRRLTSAFVVTTAALAMGVSAAAHETEDIPPDDVTMEDVAKLVKIIELTNAEGETSKIAKFYNKNYDEYLQKKMQTRAWQKFKDQPYYIDVPLHDYLLKHGFDNNTDTLVTQITANYDPQRGYKINAPFPYQFQHQWKHPGASNGYSGPSVFFPELRVLETMEKDIFPPSPQCAAVRLSTTYNGEAWTRSFLGMLDSPRGIHVPDKFGGFYSEFFLYHELAHCMGANEEQADYVATKMLLKENHDTKDALGFLKLLRSIRAADAIDPAMSQNYRQNFLAIDRAVREFERNGMSVPESHEELWSLASRRKNFLGAQIFFIIASVDKDLRMLIIKKDYKGLAAHLAHAAKSYPEEEQRTLAFEIVKGLNILGKVVDEIPPVMLPPVHVYPK